MNTKRLLATGALVGIGVGAARWLARPLDGQRVIVDWEGVRERAYARTQDVHVPLKASVASRLAKDYAKRAETLAEPLRDACGSALPEIPPIVVLDRRGFIDLNIEIMRDIVEPLIAAQRKMPETRLSSINRHLGTVLLGEMTGLIAQRVLGQFDPVLGGTGDGTDRRTPTLYMVEENIAVLERKFDAPADDLRTWIMLHELTHAWQFALHPWLREYFATTLTDISKLNLGKGWGDVVKLPRIIQEEFDVVSRIQSVMSVLEGHGNFVARIASEAILPGFDEVIETLERRHSDHSIPERILYTTTGMSMKMQQYIVGEAFLTAIHERHGAKAVQKVWNSLESFPTPTELRHPDSWYERISKTKKVPAPV